MTSHNCERFISFAIRSAIRQSYKDWELIIWDDGSTDKTFNIANKFAIDHRSIRLFKDVKRGRIDALIKATNQARGDYIGLLDADDMLAPNALTLTTDYLDSHSNVGVVYSHAWLVDNNNVKRSLCERSLMPYSREKLLDYFMTFHFRLIRREVFEQIGGWNKSYPVNMDYELCLRLSEVTHFHLIPEPLYYYRFHDGQISKHRNIEQSFYGKKANFEAIMRRRIIKSPDLLC